MKLKQKLGMGYLRAFIRMTALVSKEKAAKQALRLFSTPMQKPKIADGPLFHKAEKLLLSLKGHRLQGYRWINRKAISLNAEAELPRKVLILHGFESNALKFSDFIQGFLKKGHEVYGLDAPAHGNSGGKQINLPLYVEAIRVFCEQYGPMNSYLAHSLGGLAICHYLESVPTSPDTRLVLIAPATEARTAADQFSQLLGLDEETKEIFERLMIEKIGHPPDFFSVRRTLHEIKANIRWFHDRLDRITPIRDVKPVIEDSLPNVEIILTEGLGHRRIYRDEAVIKQAIEFI